MNCLKMCLQKFGLRLVDVDGDVAPQILKPKYLVLQLGFPYTDSFSVACCPRQPCAQTIGSQGEGKKHKVSTARKKFWHYAQWGLQHWQRMKRSSLAARTKPKYSVDIMSLFSLMGTWMKTQSPTTSPYLLCQTSKSEYLE